MPTNFLHQRFTFHAYKKLPPVGLVVLFIFVAGILPVFAGDVFYGKVSEVRSAEVVIVNLDGVQEIYTVRIAGIDAPREGPIATKAKEFVSTLLLGKNVRGRLEGRNKSGEMVARLFTDIPGVDVGLEMIKAGLARRQAQYDYKYGEMAVAERAARKSRRGLWAK